MSMEHETLVLRRSVEALGSVKHRRRFDGDLRRRLGVHACERAAAGTSLAEIARSLDVSWKTMQGFLKSASTSRSSLVPVKVITAPEQVKSRLVVRGACGVVVDGATVAEVAELLARLSSCSG
jgi:transposase-like protein